ncbi:MAG TPA: hypothetical protein VGN63_11370 [Flavisolibacter sp.]|jgi:hypothetical protein|nr:hypothetical protein [Flavisolibacter sp.]
MKRIVIAILVVLIGVSDVQAQKGKKGKKAVQQKTAKQKEVTGPTGQSDTISLRSSGTYQAYGAGIGRFTITDPIVNIFNQRANNAPVSFNGKDIIGMPGSTYGIANGRILLRNTTATTPGTNYGSGAVGTGTTLLGLGVSENAISVNGKSPYAGPWLWGDKLPSRNLAPFLRDSTAIRR